MSEERHLTPEQIAMIAEGRMSETEAAGAMEHLSRCRSCMAAYSDAVRYAAAWLAVPKAFEPPDALLKLARDEGPQPRAERAHSSPAHRRWAPIAATATAALGLVVVGVIRLTGEHGPALPAGVCGVLARPGSGLVIPGAVAPEFSPGDVFRGTDTA